MEDDIQITVNIPESIVKQAVVKWLKENKNMDVSVDSLQQKHEGSYDDRQMVGYTANFVSITQGKDNG